MREIEQRAVAGQVERRWALKSGRLGLAWHLCQWIKWFNNPYFMVMSWHLTEIAHSKCMVLSLAHSSVQFSCSVVSHSLQPHGLQHARLPCPSPTPGAYSNSCPSCWWHHATISSSVISFSSCLQSFPASGSFSMSLIHHIWWPKYWSFSFSISPSNEYSGLISFTMDWLDLSPNNGTFYYLNYFKTVDKKLRLPIV